ncbi:MAG: hypothetical protein ACRD2X_05910 [Vicinamibacteraceae bacterium]
MTTKPPFVRIGACALWLLLVGAASGLLAVQAPDETSGRSAFAKGNLHAWAFEEYDAVARTPAERARMLRDLGITRAGFIGRHVERMKELDSYIAAYREHDIDLIAVWTPINTDRPLEEPHIRMFLDGVARHRLQLQWWVTLERFDKAPSGPGVEQAAAILRPVVAAAAARGLQLALYGHGRDAWFTQPENEIAIIDRLRTVVDVPVGIAYNFHHAHSQLGRFAQVLPTLKPYLMAVNLNGMKAAGPQIIPVGQGDREQEMIALIHRSGYRGPAGLIAHQRTEDAAKVLSRNMAGLRGILEAIGDAAGASTF